MSLHIMQLKGENSGVEGGQFVKKKKKTVKKMKQVTSMHTEDVKGSEVTVQAQKEKRLSHILPVGLGVAVLH